MPLDPSIPLGLVQQQPSTLDLLGKLMGMRERQQQIYEGQSLRDERDAQTRSRNEGLADDDAIRTVLQRHAQSVTPWQQSNGSDSGSGGTTDMTMAGSHNAMGDMGSNDPSMSRGGGGESVPQLRPHDPNSNAIVSGGIDLDAAIYDLHAMGRGGAALKLQDKVFDWRIKQADEAQKTLANNKSRLELASQIARGITGDESFKRAKPQIAELVGQKYADMLGSEYNPDLVGEMVDKGESSAELLARQHEAFGQAQDLLKMQQGLIKDGREWVDKQPALANGWTKIGSNYLSMAQNQQDWDNGLTMLKSGMDGLPVSTRQAVMANFSPQFSKQSVEQARVAGMTQDERSSEKARGAQLAFEKTKADQQDDQPLSTEAVDILAKNFINTGGQLPAFGLGKTAASNRFKVFDRVGELGKGLDLAQQKIVFDAVKTNVARVQGLLANVDAFENTALSNLKVFVDQAKKTVDTGSPLLNKPIRSMSEQVLGSPQMSAFNTARTIVVPEFARILNSANLAGQLTESQRAEVDKIIKGDATLNQVYSAANILVQDAHNRRTGYQSELDALMKLVSQQPATNQGDTRNAAPGATPAQPARAAGAGPQGGQGGTASKSKPGTVRMREKDGKTYDVPFDRVSEALKDGAVVVQ